MSFDLLHGFELGPWKVEPLRGAITGPQGRTHHLEPKVMDVFVFLAEHTNELVTRDELQEAVWNGRAVTDESLTRAIGELRHALEDVGGDSKYIETVPKRGYRLIGDIYVPDGSRLEKDLTGSQSIAQLKQHKLPIAVVLALALTLVYFAYDEFVIEPAQEEALATDSIQKIVVTEVQQSIAVLPFVNMSDDPANEYFAEGISDEIRNLLGRIPDLTVIGRTSSHAFKGKNEDLRIIGQHLGVSTVLEGTVQKSGDRVRITVQLIDASDGTLMWSNSYERMMTDIFAVQDDVAADVIAALQVHVGTRLSRGRPTDSLEAYTLFLKARAALYGVNVRKAEGLLFDAIDLDTNFAEAYEFLAFLYWASGGVGQDAIATQELVHVFTAKAIAIDPKLLFADVFYKVSTIGFDYQIGMIELLELAISKQPNNPWLLDALVWMLQETGYMQESLPLAERYLRVDPLSSFANAYYIGALYAVGRTEEALTRIDVGVQSDMGIDTFQLTMLGIMLAENRDDFAIEKFASWLPEHDDLGPGWFMELAEAARESVSGQALLDRRILELLASLPEEEAFAWQETLPALYLFFGHLDRYFELILASSPTDKTWHMAANYVWQGTVFRRFGFTSHPGYLEVVNLLGINRVWEKRGPPDFCEKVGGEWVCE